MYGFVPSAKAKRKQSQLRMISSNSAGSDTARSFLRMVNSSYPSKLGNGSYTAIVVGFLPMSKVSSKFGSFFAGRTPEDTIGNKQTATGQRLDQVAAMIRIYFTTSPGQSRIPPKSYTWVYPIWTSSLAATALRRPLRQYTKMVFCLSGRSASALLRISVSGKRMALGICPLSYSSWVRTSRMMASPCILCIASCGVDFFCILP